MICNIVYCYKPGKYVVTTPPHGLDYQVSSTQFYCLKHARDTFKLNVIMYLTGVKVYKVECIAKDEKGIF